MFKIYFFRFTEAAHASKLLDPTHIKNINQHYVLGWENKFVVMTSKSIPGLKSHYIHTPNIEGQKIPQYVIEHVHQYNPKYHLLELSAKGMQYLSENYPKFEPVIETLKQIT